MGSITSAGVGSGLDLESIISALVNAEAQPKAVALNRQEANFQTKLSGLGALKSALSKFNDAVAKLTKLEDFQKVKATSSDTTILTGTATTSALAGKYTITVDALATGSRLETPAAQEFANSSALVAPTLTGTEQVVFKVGATEKFRIDVTATTTLTQLRTAINAAGTSSGISASIVNTGTGSRLVINSTTTGVGNTLEVSAANAGATADLAKILSSSAGGNLLTQASTDASITLDNITVTSSSNTFTDIVDGVTLTVSKKTVAGSPATLTVANDTATVSSALKSLTDSFNELVKTFKALGSVAEGATGPLVGDAQLRQIESRLRTALGQTVATGGLFTNLSELGITTKKDGTLNLDTAKADKALNSGFLDVGKVFAGTGGVATSLKTSLDSYLGTGGTLTTRETSLQSQIEDIDKQRDQLDYRIGQLESRLRKQFASLDSLVATLNSTSLYLAQNLPKITTNTSKK